MNLTYHKETSNSAFSIFHLEGKILTTEDTADAIADIEEGMEKNELFVIFNLENLEYINSTGLNFIISTFTKLRNAGGELIICCVSQKVEDLLVITKLNTIFTICESLEEAEENFAEKK